MGWAEAGGIVSGVLAALIFGGGAVVSRHLVSTEASPADLVAARYLGSFPVALALYALRGSHLFDGLTPGRLLILLLLAGPPYHLVLLSAYGDATSGAGALIIGGLVPVLTSAFLIPTRRPTWATMLSWALTFGGLLILAVAAHAMCAPASAALFAIAAALWAGFNVAVSRWRLDPLALTAVLALSAPLLLPVYLSLGATGGGVRGGALLLQIGYHGLVVGWLATWLVVRCARRAGAGAASASVALIPLFALLLGAAVLDEPFGPPQAAAVALVMGGVILGGRAVPPRRL